RRGPVMMRMSPATSTLEAATFTFGLVHEAIHLSPTWVMCEMTSAPPLASRPSASSTAALLDPDTIRFAPASKTLAGAAVLFSRRAFFAPCSTMGDFSLDKRLRLDSSGFVARGIVMRGGVLTGCSRRGLLEPA